MLFIYKTGYLSVLHTLVDHRRTPRYGLPLKLRWRVIQGSRACARADKGVGGMRACRQVGHVIRCACMLWDGAPGVHWRCRRLTWTSRWSDRQSSRVYIMCVQVGWTYGVRTAYGSSLGLYVALLTQDSGGGLGFAMMAE